MKLAAIIVTLTAISLPIQESASFPLFHTRTTDKIDAREAIDLTIQPKKALFGLWSRASEKGLNKSDTEQIINTIECESNWRPHVVGDNGTSYGLVQIHIPAHPHITPEQAKDPEFAIDFITTEFAKGNQWKWSCWNKLYGN